jgi:hypothetical protein
MHYSSLYVPSCICEQVAVDWNKFEWESNLLFLGLRQVKSRPFFMRSGGKRGGRKCQVGTSGLTSILMSCKFGFLVMGNTLSYMYNLKHFVSFLLVKLVKGGYD